MTTNVAPWVAWWLAIRPKTLPAVIAPVLTGQFLAYCHSSESFDKAIFACILICAVCLQIAVNLANDVFDFKRGVDSSDRLGPRRAAHQGWLTPQQLMRAVLWVLLVAVISGAVLVLHGGWLFLLFGIASVIAALAYSAGPWPLSSNALGEITVFLFFGLLAVCGGYYLHTFDVSPQAWQIGVAMGFLTAAIMLVNNLRDRVSDEKADKTTLVILVGPTYARGIYSLMLLAPSSWLITETVLGWLALILALGLCWRVFHNDGEKLNQLLAQTAAFCLVYALLFVAGHLL